MDSPEQTADRLLAATDGAERERILAEGAESAVVVSALVARARAALATAGPEAVTAADLAAGIAARAGELLAAAGAHRVRGQALRVFGRHDEAIAALREAARAAGEAGDRRLAAQVQMGSIDSLGWLGRFDEAARLGRRLERELRELGHEADAARAIVNVANVRYRRDQYSKALEDYLRAADTFRSAGDSASAARVDANAANAHLLLNHTGDAVALYDRARSEFEAAGLEQEAAMVDANVGYVRYVSGMLAEGLSAFARARMVFAARGQELEAAKADLASADAYRALNLHAEALQHYDRAAAVFERLGIDYELSRCELGRAAVLASTGRHPEASAAIDSADAIFRKHRNAVQSAHAALIRSSLLQSLGQADEARQHAGRAARVFARRGLRAWTAEARFPAAAHAIEESGRPVRMHRIAAAARSESRGWLESRAERALGLHYRRTGKTGRALRHLRASVAALEAARTQIAPEDLHVAFLRDKLDAYADLVSTLLDRGRPADVAEALQCVEQARSRLLLERLQAAATSERASSTSHQGPRSAAAVEALRTRLEELRAELSRGYHGLHSLDEGEAERLSSTVSNPASRETLARLEREYEAASRELYLALGSAQAAPTLSARLPGSAELCHALAEDEALVEYFVANDRVSAFVLTREGLKVERFVASAADVRHVARRLRFHMQKPVARAGEMTANDLQSLARLQEVLSRLYELTIRPIEPLLTGQKVTIVPHELLHGLPFHAFVRDPRRQECALDRWEIAYAPSAAIWHACRVRPESPRRQGATLLMGVPVPGIESVATEIAELERLVPRSRAFCGESATLDAFFEQASHHRRLHLATHALFREDNPLFSGLRFANGWLLARDLYGMRLDCDLATLSACQTGVAAAEAGDELFGLVRGFLGAGVRSVVASLWPADDEATTTLMSRFYALLNCGASRAAALRQAQSELRRSHPHPYHWAAFAVIGQR